MACSGYCGPAPGAATIDVSIDTPGRQREPQSDHRRDRGGQRPSPVWPSAVRSEVRSGRQPESGQPTPTSTIDRRRDQPSAHDPAVPPGAAANDALVEMGMYLDNAGGSPFQSASASAPMEMSVFGLNSRRAGKRS